MKIPKGVIKSRISADNTMDKRKKDKRTNNDLQNTTQKNKDWATRTPLKTGDELMCSGRVGSACSTCDIRCITVKRNEHHLTWKWCWTPVYVNRYEKHKYTWTFYKTNGNRSGHYNTELKTWRHNIPHFQRLLLCVVISFHDLRIVPGRGRDWIVLRFTDGWTFNLNVMWQPFDQSHGGFLNEKHIT